MWGGWRQVGGMFQHVEIEWRPLLVFKLGATWKFPPNKGWLQTLDGTFGLLIEGLREPSETSKQIWYIPNNLPNCCKTRKYGNIVHICTLMSWWNKNIWSKHDNGQVGSCGVRAASAGRMWGEHLPSSVAARPPSWADVQPARPALSRHHTSTNMVRHGHWGWPLGGLPHLLGPWLVFRV